MLVVERRGERPLGDLLAQNEERRRRQLHPPLRLGQIDLEPLGLDLPVRARQHARGGNGDGGGGEADDGSTGDGGH